MAKKISRSRKKTNTYIVYGIIIAAIAVVVVIAAWSNHRPSKYTPLAQCIADSGAHMYGAFWCPHCHEQEQMFGSNGMQVLKDTGVYVECSNPDHTQRPVCNDKGVKGYPTWILGNGSYLGSPSGGVQDLYTLAQATNCTATLPQ